MQHCRKYADQNISLLMFTLKLFNLYDNQVIFLLESDLLAEGDIIYHNIMIEFL